MVPDGVVACLARHAGSSGLSYQYADLFTEEGVYTCMTMQVRLHGCAATAARPTYSGRAQSPLSSTPLVDEGILSPPPWFLRWT